LSGIEVSLPAVEINMKAEEGDAKTPWILPVAWGGGGGVRRSEVGVAKFGMDDELGPPGYRN